MSSRPTFEVIALPPDSQVLAANEVSAIQAVVVQTPKRGSFHGTQYHPEHTLAVSAALMQMRAAELVEEGFATEPTKIAAIAEDYRAMDAERARRRAPVPRGGQSRSAGVLSGSAGVRLLHRRQPGNAAGALS